MIFKGLRLTEKQKNDAFASGRAALVKVGYDPDAQEEKLCENNPLYHLLFYPFRTYKTARGDSVAYIDRILGRAIDIVVNHTSYSVCEEQLVAHSLAYLRNPDIADRRVKTLGLFLCMWLHADVVDFFRSLYPASNEAGLKHFNQIVYEIVNAAEATLHTGFSCYNIKSIIDNFYETFIALYSRIPMI